MPVLKTFDISNLFNDLASGDDENQYIDLFDYCQKMSAALSEVMIVELLEPETIKKNCDIADKVGVVTTEGWHEITSLQVGKSILNSVCIEIVAWFTLYFFSPEKIDSKSSEEFLNYAGRPIEGAYIHPDGLERGLFVSRHNLRAMISSFLKSQKDKYADIYDAPSTHETSNNSFQDEKYKINETPKTAAVLYNLGYRFTLPENREEMLELLETSIKNGYEPVFKKEIDRWIEMLPMPPLSTLILNIIGDLYSEYKERFRRKPKDNGPGPSP